jgi:hypothetical protein
VETRTGNKGRSSSLDVGQALTKAPELLILSSCLRTDSTVDGMVSEEGGN